MKTTTNLYKSFISILTVVIVILGIWTYTKAEGGQITVCVKNSGLIYVIGHDFKRMDCKKNDSLLSWNSTGQIGPRGEIGPVGPEGPRGTDGIDGIQGSIGLTGPQGLKGDTGNNGIDGVSGYERVVGPMTNNSDGSKTSIATCPLGKKVIGGGYNQTTNYIFNVRSNYPNSETEWTVTGEGSSSSLNFNSYAICVIAN